MVKGWNALRTVIWSFDVALKGSSKFVPGLSSSTYFAPSTYGHLQDRQGKLHLHALHTDILALTQRGSLCILR